MSNRELLLNASKALGLEGYYIAETSNLPEGVWYADNDGVDYWWNPLLRNDQMLEMAIKLKIEILNAESFCGATSDCLDFIVNEDHNGDAMSAVRLAVTKCAASMWGRK